MTISVPLFSIIIPARNEEKQLPTCLNSILTAAKKLPNNSVEVVVVLNRCTDQTEAIALKFGAVIANNDSKNLAEIRNAGARLARGEIIVTIDADSYMSENLLLDIHSSMSMDQYIGGGVLIIPERFSLGIILTGLLVGLLLLRYRISVGLFFCKRTDFLALNGFNQNLLSAEDIDFAIRLKALGRSRKLKFKHIFSSYITTSRRKFDKFGDWYFLFNPRISLTLLYGKNKEHADSVWYDFGRD